MNNLKGAIRKTNLEIGNSGKEDFEKDNPEKNKSEQGQIGKGEIQKTTMM